MALGMKTATFLAVLVTAWFSVAFFVQRAVVFPVSVLPPVVDEPQLPDDAERWWIDVDDGRVEAFFLPGDGVSAEAPGPAVVYSHGNGELIDLLVASSAPYRALGVSVLLVEYRGYGRSDGSPSQDALVDDAARFVDRLAARPEVDGERLVLHGASLGGGVACQVAQRRSVRAVVLVATFKSIRAMAAGFFVPPPLVRDPFDNEAALDAIDVPVLVMHGRRDRVVPIDHGRALAAGRPHVRFSEWEGNHVVLTNDRRALWGTIRDFLVETGVLPPP